MQGLSLFKKWHSPTTLERLVKLTGRERSLHRLVTLVAADTQLLHQAKTLYQTGYGTASQNRVRLEHLCRSNHVSLEYFYRRIASIVQILNLVPHEETYYDLLGISRTAGRDEIKHAFRRLSLANHPDRNPADPDAAERFRSIHQAYQILINDKLRRHYDRHFAASHRNEKLAPFRDHDAIERRQNRNRYLWLMAGLLLALLAATTLFDFRNYQSERYFDSESNPWTAKPARQSHATTYDPNHGPHTLTPQADQKAAPIIGTSPHSAAPETTTSRPFHNGSSRISLAVVQPTTSAVGPQPRAIESHSSMLALAPKPIKSHEDPTPEHSPARLSTQAGALHLTPPAIPGQDGIQDATSAVHPILHPEAEFAFFKYNQSSAERPTPSPTAETQASTASAVPQHAKNPLADPEAKTPRSPTAISPRELATTPGEIAPHHAVKQTPAPQPISAHRVDREQSAAAEQSPIAPRLASKSRTGIATSKPPENRRRHHLRRKPTRDTRQNEPRLVHQTVPSRQVTPEPEPSPRRAPPAESGVETQQRVRRFLDRYTRAYQNKDLSTLMKFFAPDARENGKRVKELIPVYRRNFERAVRIRYRVSNLILHNTDGRIEAVGKIDLIEQSGNSPPARATGSIRFYLIPSGTGYRIQTLRYTFK